MNRNSVLSIVVTLALAAGVSACGGGVEATLDPEPATAQPPSTTESGDNVTYVPAYPEEVSADDLSEDDIEQQEATTHSHDGEEHSHGEGDPTNDEEDEHEGDGDGHDHDGEDHDHGSSG